MATAKKVMTAASGLISMAREAHMTKRNNKVATVLFIVHSFIDSDRRLMIAAQGY